MNRYNHQAPYTMDEDKGEVVEMLESEHRTPPRAFSTKSRSLSDGGTPNLSPSPHIKEALKPTTKDDSAINSPSTPRQASTVSRGLSLQMPDRLGGLPSSPTAVPTKTPLSPKPDVSPYGSPSNVLPRRSRGLDFSRAATSLHHSTLADSSSDSSPTVGGRPIGKSNQRSGTFSQANSDLGNHGGPSWAGIERVNTTSTISSANMMCLDDSESSSDGDIMDADDIDESILTTPHGANLPYAQRSPGGWLGVSGVASGLMDFRKSRLKPNKARHRSSSGSTHSMISPILRSSPPRNLEAGFSNVLGSDGSQARRESISWAANQLNISGNDGDESNLKSTLETLESSPITPSRDGQRGVIRRVVTRRGNMLVRSVYPKLILLAD